ncbi:MAG: glycosyl hydrolase family 8 [Frankiaceae bacterium]
MGLTVLLALLLSGCGGSSSASDATGQAQAAARKFLQDYVQPNGEVVRFDQGGDTVSEGQSYALLLSLAAGDQTTFDRVWGWSGTHLQRRDGLLAWQYSGGRVVDPQPASDADLLTAWALDLAARRFGAPAYERDSQRVRNGILAAEVTSSVMVAGPWAVQKMTVNPSYWTPAAMDRFARVDSRWAPVAAAVPKLVDAATKDGQQLPPDWGRATVALTSVQITATPPPSGAGSITYSLDAARLPVWVATSCQPAVRARAAALRPLIGTDPVTAAIAPRKLNGAPVSTDHQPLALVAAAAAADAGGDTGTRDKLLDAADQVANDTPGYYARAWAALGRVLLQTSLLEDCS